MLAELNAGGLTAVAQHLPPEVVDGSDEAQLVAWAGNGCAAAIEQLGSDAKKAWFSAWPASAITRYRRSRPECILQSLLKVGRVSGTFALLHLARADCLE